MYDPLLIEDLVRDELAERREDGYLVDAIATRTQAAALRGGDAADAALAELEQASRREDWPYEEPSTLAEIEAACAGFAAEPDPGPTDLADRVLAGWLGRCAGCMLGKPFELWSRGSIRRYMELADAYPIRDYIPKLEPVPVGMELNPSWPETTQGRITAMARDDDTDYTILGLHILETHGFGFGPEHVALEWLDHFPVQQVYTAERAAVRNLVNGLAPPETAWHRNPYRQWIGAQIRADMWGYVSPGDPASAARLAFADASLSHVQNGIYGEMWASALIALAFTSHDEPTAVARSLAFVPERSRLAEALRLVLDLRRDELSFDGAMDEIERRYGALSPVHTINNAAVVAAALLWGEGDFTQTIGLAVAGGWDTDCNGATAGSVFGVMHGTNELPARWVKPLDDRMRSALFGFDGSRISDLAARTARLAGTGRNGGSPSSATEKEATWTTS